MTGNEYQQLSMRTNDGQCNKRLVEKTKDMAETGEIVNACLGLSGEAGEFNDLIKKWIFHESPLYVEHAKKELGDIMWYIALMCEAFGWTLDEILQMNVEKLQARYPKGFDPFRANHKEKEDV